MFPRAMRIATIGGIDVRIDASWLPIAALAGFSFWDRFRHVYAHGMLAATAMALAVVIAFFTSVLVHELAHALESKHRGLEVGGVTLFLFGGVTETSADVRRPFDEFALAAVGPYASVVAAAVFGLVSAFGVWVGSYPIADAAGLLAWSNLGLAIFNLLPGAPLDGGRVLRAGLWALTRDRARAVRGAARAGQALALALVGLAIFALLRWRGALGNALWLLLIGAFLLRGATTELRLGRALALDVTADESP